MKKIVLATQNPHKVLEFNEMLADLDIQVIAASEFPDLEEVVEDGETLQANALKKARYVVGVTGLPALADDTGLEVDALDGRPGVYSARYAGENVTYQDNVLKLLKELSEIRDLNKRTARFRTVIAFVTGGEEYLFEGVCQGRILREEKGKGGFGYDPVFLPDGYEETFAQMSMEVKNKISHRGKAIARFYQWLSETVFEEK